MIPDRVRKVFQLESASSVKPYGSGHINKTFKVISRAGTFILQRVNHFVFKEPYKIDENISNASRWLRKHQPEYLFLSPLPSSAGNTLERDDDGNYWRCFPFIDGVTVNEVSAPGEAKEAAIGFSRLTRFLTGCNLDTFHIIIPRFHDLAWRYEQFTDAHAQANEERLKQAYHEIALAKKYKSLVTEYTRLLASGDLTLRITHNDTKINNILFDGDTRESKCVVDLDTLMPGYFIYDLGDMVRTFVSPVSEQTEDASRIVFREEIYQALVEGYMQEMQSVLSTAEIKAVPFAGKMMTYMIGLRFLTDYLEGDHYFAIAHPTQNLVRARNQFRLLELLMDAIK